MQPVIILNAVDDAAVGKSVGFMNDVAVWSDVGFWTDAAMSGVATYVKKIDDWNEIRCIDDCCWSANWDAVTRMIAGSGFGQKIQPDPTLKPELT